MSATTCSKHKVYEVVEGNLKRPGRVLKTFSSAEQHKCGGPATAALRWWDAHHTAAAPLFFRRVA